MNNLLKSQDRGRAEHGWLQSRHSFSFANYFNPDQMGFSDLLVINDDRVEPQTGFGRHPHQNMEIFSYVLEGGLKHQDSMGHQSVIRSGDIQLMSAGRGVTHSELNASSEDSVHFLQIWIVPAQANTEPNYRQKHFTPEQKRGRLCLMLSPDGAQGSLHIGQDARVYAGCFDGQEQTHWVTDPSRYFYIHLAQGALTVNGHRLTAGDGLRLRNPHELHVSEGVQAEVLVFDLRPHELPQRH